MKTYTMIEGRQQVVITEDCGTFSARLYLNHGDTASLQSWKGTTITGAIKWAQKQLTGK